MVEHERGKLLLDVHDENGNPVKHPIHVLLSQNISALGNQYRITTKGGDDDVGGEFPPGSYTAQVFVHGYDVARDAITLTSDHTTRKTIRLEPRSTFHKPSLEERLAVYGLKADQLQSLEIRSDRRVVLDYRTYPISEHFTLLHPKSINDVKRWVGAPDAAFAPGQARFSPLAEANNAQKLAMAGREFVYGNSQAVGQYTSALNEEFDRRAGLILIAIFLFREVTIYDGATLEIGNGSSVFFADQLTVYPTGTLLVSGDVRSDIGLYQQL